MQLATLSTPARTPAVSQGNSRVPAHFSTTAPHFITSAGLKEQNFTSLLPLLHAAEPISAKTFDGATGLLDVSADAVNQYRIWQMPPDHLERLKKAHYGRARGDAIDAVTKLLEALLPRVHVKQRGELALDDVWVYMHNIARGAYFPDLHWDYDWSMFPEAPGFNLWCMVEPAQAEARGTGNMYLGPGPDLLPSDPPVGYGFAGDEQPGHSGVTKFLHVGDSHGKRLPLKGYRRAADMRIDWKYLNMTPGECLVFSKRTLHMSDPRPHLDPNRPDFIPVGQLQRLAMNVRIVVRPRRGARQMNFWSGHEYARKKMTWSTWACKWARHRQVVGGYEQVNIYSPFDWMFGLPDPPAAGRHKC